MAHKVVGSKVYDARLVATMNSYGVKSILTFNAADFARYQHGSARSIAVVNRAPFVLRYPDHFEGVSC